MFYEAIGQRNLDALMGLWACDEEVACVQPDGQQSSGIEAIRESWHAVFEASKMRLVSRNLANWQGAVMALFHNIETRISGEPPQPDGALILATHMFMLGAQGWRLVCRHTSYAANQSGEPPSASGGDHTLH